MKPPHSYRLRAYHNPENVDESRVPDGWRMRYADEAATIAPGACIAWLSTAKPPRWSQLDDWPGKASSLTYIVPVDA